jgi:hypothetical protein
MSATVLYVCEIYLYCVQFCGGTFTYPTCHTMYNTGAEINILILMLKGRVPRPRDGG